MKLFHKCTAYGLYTLLKWQICDDPVLCCSSENSSNLFWRDICVVLNVVNPDIVAECSHDIDARIQTGYDEVRVRIGFTTFMKSIEAIIVTPGYLRSLRAGITTSSEVFPIANEYCHLKHHLAEKYSIRDWWRNVETNYPVKTVKQSGYSYEFLNLR